MASAGVLREPQPLAPKLGTDDEDDDDFEAAGPRTDASKSFSRALAARFRELEHFVSDEFRRLENRQSALRARHGPPASPRGAVVPSKWRVQTAGAPEHGSPPPSSISLELPSPGDSQVQLVDKNRRSGSFGDVMQDSSCSIRSRPARCSFAAIDEEFDIKPQSNSPSVSIEGGGEESHQRTVRSHPRVSQRMSALLSQVSQRGYKTTFNLDWVATSADHRRNSATSRGWFRCWLSSLRSPEKQSVFVDTFMGIVVLLNCAIIGISSDIRKGWRGWSEIDAAFATLFLLEVFMKMRIHGLHYYMFGDRRRWHLLEIFLMLLAWFEVYLNFSAENAQRQPSDQFSLFRLLRLVRIARLLRVCDLRMMSDLMVMVKGTLGGIKTLLWSTVLISLPLYAVSLIFRETLGTEGQELFDSVPLSFFTVFRCIVAGECTDRSGRPIFAIVADAHGWGYACVYCIIRIFFTFGLFNVIVAIFVENVVAGAKTNALLMKRTRLRDERFLATKLIALLQHVVEMHWERTLTASNGLRFARMSVLSNKERAEMLLVEASKLEITPEFFEELLKNADVMEILRDLDISDEDSMTLFETLDVDGSGVIDVEELFDGISKLRGDARRSDVIRIMFMLQRLQGDFKDYVSSVEAAKRSHSGDIANRTAENRRGTM